MKTKFLFILILSFFTSKNATAQSSFAVEVKGKGEPVLLLPGFGCTGAVWDATVAELSKTNECHVFTFAGFGKVAPINSPWLSQIKDELITYVKSKKLKKPTLIGHSLGGTLSLWMAIQETTLFKKIIAVDAIPCAAALMIPNYKGDVIPYDNPQSKMMLNMDDKSFHAMNAQSTPFMCLNKEKQKLINEWMAMADRKTYVNGYIDLLNLDLRKDIAKIKIPVFVLAATQPNLETVTKTYTDQYQNLPSITIHYAENSAHFVMFDQPEWYLKEVKQIMQ
jgi:pimeloyl-ACP methyl ester carboxylesterase